MSRGCLCEGVSAVRKSAVVSHLQFMLSFLVRTQLTQCPSRTSHYATLDSHRAGPRGPIFWCLMCDQSPPNVTWGLDPTGMSKKSEVKGQVILLFFPYKRFIKIQFICCNSSHPFRVHNSVVL